MRSPSPRRTPATAAGRMMLRVLVVTLFVGTGCDPAIDATPRIGRAEPSASGGEASAGGSTASDDGGVVAKDFTGRSVAVRDRSSDRSTTGRAPRFVEIDAAAIDGDAASLTLSMTLAGPDPSLMPDEVTTMRVTFTIVSRGGDRYEFFAHATRNGWAAFASGREGADPPFTDDLRITGRTIAMTIDRSYLGPPTPFEWTANMAWTRRAERGEAYAFDFVPKRGYADFP